MSQPVAVVVGTVLFAVGAIGVLIWIWVKRRQVARAAETG
jgi:preprotein translocase subunit Sss1